MTKDDTPLGRVRNWDEFQHYGGKRNLVWLKLYPRIFFDPEFIKLTDAQRYHVIACFMVALQTGNEFPLDEEYLGRVFNATTRVNIKALLASRFIEDINPASNVASKKREEKKKRREEKKREENVNWTMEEWNEVATELGLATITAMTNPRTSSAKARIKQFGEDEVRRAINAPRESAFLQGKKTDRRWKVTFDWMMKPSNMTKVLEDSYRDHDLPKRRSKKQIEDDERRTQLMQHIERYSNALLRAIIPLSGPIQDEAVRHADRLAKLIATKESKVDIVGEFFKLHDRFIKEVYLLLPKPVIEEIDGMTAQAAKLGTKVTTYRRKLIEERCKLPDPLDFEIDDSDLP